MTALADSIGFTRRLEPPAPVAIIGAGFAGLVAATELTRRGMDVVVFEGSKSIAGLAATFRDASGFTYDTGAHFLTNRLTAALGADGTCRTVRYYGESVLLGRRIYRYPWGLLTKPAFAWSSLSARLANGARTKAPPVNAAEWFRATYGRALADRVALPLLACWSGTPPEQLSPAVGTKMGSVFETIRLSIAARLTRRAVAIGYSHEKRQSMHVWHVYPPGGVASLCHRLAAELGPRVLTEAPVEKVLVSRDRVTGLRVKGTDVPVAAAFSTAPLDILARITDGTDRLEPLRRFRYRGMMAVNLALRGRGLLSDAVVWLPEGPRPFYRLTEAPISMPWLAPDGQTMITVDVGADPGDPWWTETDERVVDASLYVLERVIPDVRQRLQGSHVLRLGKAYPLFLLDYEAERQALVHGSGVDGLVLIGRNGEFGHWLMEDVYWRTLKTVRCWLASAGSRTLTESGDFVPADTDRLEDLVALADSSPS
jgi:protoporphyrinogen oxidase